MSLKTQNIYTFLCFHISTHSNKILNALENFTQICELILHIMCKLLLNKYVLNNQNEHKLCKIILIKSVISNKTCLCKIFPHIFFYSEAYMSHMTLTSCSKACCKLAKDRLAF